MGTAHRTGARRDAVRPRRWTLILMVVPALALGACMKPPSPEAFLQAKRDAFASALGVDGEVVEQNAKILFNLATALEARETVDCAAPEWPAAVAAAEKIERKAFTRLVLARERDGLVAMFREVNLEAGEVFARRAVEGRILLANTALQHGCKAIASRQFRFVVKTYRTEAFETYHTLAKSSLSELWSAAASL